MTTPEVETPETPKTTAPKEVVLFSFTAVHGVMYHPLGNPRPRFAPDLVTHHELDDCCKMWVAAGALKIV